MMNDIAFVFPGQGSQYSGMGQLLAAEFPEAARTFEEADDTLGFSLSQLCFAGAEEDLKQTENMQPALLAVSVAAYRVLAGRCPPPSRLAGHSLGEYSALVAAGSLHFPDALRLVRLRGCYMQQAVPPGVGAMSALIKLPAGQLDHVLAEAAQGEIVQAANFNSPEQVVIAGHTAAVARAEALARAAGAKRAIRLPVSAPFHCSLMRPAQAQLQPHLDAAPFQNLNVPVVNNWQARPVSTASAARLGLFEQIPNPVQWTETILEMAHSGCRRFVEVGAGSVLLGLLRKIDASLQSTGFGEPADMTKLEALLA
ncbi:MAG TPA: ACP S-malonyltransferase [Bryobacteraceae bacterium]|nr:ACP S-malonyltransferase [Bryobacteraceae bacterium]